jgi:hypothetical protein
MVKLLDLPPELRVMIWKLCVLSPKGRLAYLDLENGDSPAKRDAQFIYTSNPLFVDDNDYKTEIKRLCFQPKLAEPTSLSSFQTNRQIYTKSRHVFWEHTCFNYDSPWNLHHDFERMGCIASGCIRSIRLHVPKFFIQSTGVPHFVKLFKILIDRRGASDQQSSNEVHSFQLRKFDLVIDVAELIWIMLLSQDKLPYTRKGPAQYPSYHKILKVLRSGRSAGFERRIIINCTSIEGFHASDIVNSSTGVAQVLKELHENWGGKLLWGKKLIWDNMEEVNGGFKGLLDHKTVRWQGKHDPKCLDDPKTCYGTELQKLTYYANTRNLGRRI